MPQSLAHERNKAAATRSKEKALKRAITGAAILAAAITGCGSEDPEAPVEDAPSPEASPTADAVSTPTPSPSPHTSPETTEPVSPGEDMTIECQDAERGSTGTFESPEEAWEELGQEERARCSATFTDHTAESYELTELEVYAVETAGYDDASSLRHLYGMCAASHLGDFDELRPWSEPQVMEAEGALDLCPDHPEREIVEERIGEVDERHEAMEEREAARDRGEYFGPGAYLVGDEMQPGTYVAESESGFEGCYWERLDNAGNVIDNNFIHQGFRAEVTIQESDYSFSSERCGGWELQD